MQSGDRHEDRDAVYRDVTRAAGFGLLANCLLAAAKLAGGIAGQSFALIADAINSLGDVVTTIVVLIAFRVAQKPADPEHPYGHTRAEGIAASNVALLIIVSAVLVAWETVTHLGAPRIMPPGWTLWVAGINVVVKEGLYHYKVRVGRRTGSTAIIANAWDHRGDALCALAVLAGLSAVRWGGPGLAWADSAASLLVVGAIVWSGVALFRRSGSELMDVQAEPELVNQIRSAALRVEGVADVETLWVRKSGIEYFADIHIEVDAEMTVARGHRIGHDVKDRLMHEFSALRDVLVHLEPHPHIHPQPPPSAATGPQSHSSGNPCQVR